MSGKIPLPPSHFRRRRWGGRKSCTKTADLPDVPNHSAPSHFRCRRWGGRKSCTKTANLPDIPNHSAPSHFRRRRWGGRKSCIKTANLPDIPNHSFEKIHHVIEYYFAGVYICLWNRLESGIQSAILSYLPNHKIKYLFAGVYLQTPPPLPPAG